MRALAAAVTAGGGSPPAHAPFPPVLLRLFEQEGGHICERAPSSISYCAEAIVTTLRLCAFLPSLISAVGRSLHFLLSLSFLPPLPTPTPAPRRTKVGQQPEQRNSSKLHLLLRDF